MNTYQIEYLRAWKEAFAQFLGWSEHKTLSWAKPLLDGMDPPGMVINEPPLYYVAREMAALQPYYDDLSQTRRFELGRAVQDVLAPDLAGREFPPGFDFDAARRKLDRLLRNAAQSGGGPLSFDE
jgi:hypothetical protein